MEYNILNVYKEVSPMNIALLGFGVVGSGVYEWCRNRED